MVTPASGALGTKKRARTDNEGTVTPDAASGSPAVEGSPAEGSLGGRTRLQKAASAVGQALGGMFSGAASSAPSLAP